MTSTQGEASANGPGLSSGTAAALAAAVAGEASGGDLPFEDLRVAKAPGLRQDSV